MKKAILSVAMMMAWLPAQAADLADAVAEDYNYILDLYTHFHKNPELSFQEKESARRMSAELKALGFKVTEGVGDKWVKAKIKADGEELRDGVGGYGVVGVMENGEGPTIMLRADMDALPLQEKTGLSYASTVMGVDFRGQNAPVMHACAHDSHMAILIGAARQLVAMKDEWSGTLVLIAQPAEELGLGARAMLEDGLYKKFPKPDYVLATHTSGHDPAGFISYTPGWALANVDSVDITVRGVGTHGSTPQLGKDPIMISAQIVNALQTLVSREIDPQSAGVVTVGSLHAGYKHNIISDEAHLQLTVRSYEDGVRAHLLAGIERIAKAQALSAGLPEDMMPIVKIEKEGTPATFNDLAMSERVMGAVATSIGPELVYERPASMGGEDFSLYGRTADDIPTVIFWTGGVDPKVMKAAREGKGPAPASNHSPFFAPVPDLTLKTGVQAMTAGALELFQN